MLSSVIMRYSSFAPMAAEQDEVLVKVLLAVLAIMTVTTVVVVIAAVKKIKNEKRK
ncbi:MAG: hypothetical protein OEY64_08800 [Nitrospinota bacterium]|nr:hypothetical protein [Nitrospinota bacterium]